MNLQVLLSVMNTSAQDAIKRARLQSDAVIINQSDAVAKEVVSLGKYAVQYYSLNEQGIGRSRNAALQRATADIVLLCDDDVLYVDGYRQIVLDEFEKYPNADMIIFAVPSTNADRPSPVVNTLTRVRWYNALRYGAYRIAFKRTVAAKHNLTFSLQFGGGAQYSSGEDSLFIYDALRSGMKIYATPTVIGEVSHQESTWFEGYTDKFFRDKGALFRALSPNAYVLLIVQFALRKRTTAGKGRTLREVFSLMMQGARDWKAI